jgi:FtsP/CotA-like multicopper oxidase with cupredoxin domain
LTATRGRVALVGKPHPNTDVWCYDGRVPGPEIRLRQGEPVRIIVQNNLTEGTTVHWHGIRLPIAMDGVPGISQPLIRSGERFVYEFTPPDAGTFWYHPHADSLQQLGRGMAGALIVEEPQPLPVDRDVLWMLADWRLTAKAQIASGFGNGMEASMSGRVGNTVTINGVVSREELCAPASASVYAWSTARLPGSWRFVLRGTIPSSLPSTASRVIRTSRTAAAFSSAPRCESISCSTCRAILDSAIALSTIFMKVCPIGSLDSPMTDVSHFAVTGSICPWSFRAIRCRSQT